MKPDERQEWQKFLGEVLIELVNRDGVTVLNPKSKKALNADEITAAFRSGRSMRVSVLPNDVLEPLASMRRYMKLFHRGIVTTDELVMILKEEWNQLDGLATDWLEEFYEQLILLHGFSGDHEAGSQPQWRTRTCLRLYNASIAC